MQKLPLSVWKELVEEINPNLLEEIMYGIINLLSSLPRTEINGDFFINLEDTIHEIKYDFILTKEEKK